MGNVTVPTRTSLSNSETACMIAKGENHTPHMGAFQFQEFIVW